MNFDELFSQYRAMTDHKILMSFKGVFAQPALVEMGNSIRNTVGSDAVGTVVMKKIFAIFIELSQNILFYSAEKEVDLDGREGGVGILVVSDNGDRYCVSSGNLMLNQNVDRMRERCEKVASMNKEELRAYYNEQRKRDRPADSKGAGLGFIDMARKSDYSLQFAITPFDEQHSFFMISSYISKGQQ
jgi:hypothetical protein